MNTTMTLSTQEQEPPGSSQAFELEQAARSTRNEHSQRERRRTREYARARRVSK